MQIFIGPSSSKPSQESDRAKTFKEECSGCWHNPMSLKIRASAEPSRSVPLSAVPSPLPKPPSSCAAPKAPCRPSLPPAPRLQWSFSLGSREATNNLVPWGWRIAWLGTGTSEWCQAPQHTQSHVPQHAGHTELGQAGRLLLQLPAAPEGCCIYSSGKKKNVFFFFVSFVWLCM